MRGDRQRAELLQGDSEKMEPDDSGVIVVGNFRPKKESHPWSGGNALKKSGRWTLFFAATVVD